MINTGMSGELFFLAEDWIAVSEIGLTPLFLGFGVFGLLADPSEQQLRG